MKNFISTLAVCCVLGANAPEMMIAGNKSPLASQDSIRAIRSLQSEIDVVLSNKNLKKSNFGVVVYSLDSKKTYYSKNGASLLTPASTTKLFSTYAALYKLSGNYALRTIAYTDAPPAQNGILNGNIYVVGAGDPLLEVTDLDNIIAKIKSFGIKRITGGIYGDGSFFDNATKRAEYSGDREEVEPLAPISGLSINHNRVTVVISGTKSGLAVSTSPACNGAFSFSVKTIQPKSKRAKGGISIQQSTLPNGKQNFSVSGYLAPGKSTSYTFFINNPVGVTAEILKNRLEANGIAVQGHSGIQEKPANAVYVAEFQRPLREVVAFVNKHSDNFSAEHVLKLVSASQGIRKNQTQESIKILKSCMNERFIPSDMCKFNDGCGLSRRNTTSPNAQVRLLTEAANMGFFEDYYNSFPIAGRDGTLKKRLKRTYAEGNVTAKTGTLRNVSALSGYVTTLDGEHLAFSLLFNGAGVGAYKDIENKIAVALASFSFSDKDLAKK